ncbi:transposase, partial [Clostridium haemolyticum]
KEGSLKAFISTDLVLKPLDIIFKYTDRWAIEPFFRDCKNYLGLDSYQVRSERSILRYLTIMFITYTYCKLYSSKTLQFNTGLKLAKNDFKKSQIIFIYSAALNGQPIEKIFENLKIA